MWRDHLNLKSNRERPAIKTASELRMVLLNMHLNASGVKMTISLEATL